MNLRRFASLLFLAGLGALLATAWSQFPFAHSPATIGAAINAQGAARVGTANLVTSVVLGYRGLDTMGELTILFVAATAIGLVLGHEETPRQSRDGAAPGQVLHTSAGLLFPFLLVLGAYIILHGHLTPGGGFQGGAILAAAFFIPVLAGRRALNEGAAAVLEGLAGIAFIVIGLIALAQHADFLTPLFGTGRLGHLVSAGSLPLLYMAVGLKVGAELAGLLVRLGGAEEAP